MAAANGTATGGDRLVTPEAVLLDYPLATVGSRAIALLLDLTVLSVAFLLLVIGGSAIVGASGIALPGWLAVTLILLLTLLLQLGYPILLETTWRGRTLGKAAMGLRVLTSTGGPIGVRHAALRAIVGIVDFQLSGGLAAFVSALVTRQHQRLGDLAAGTVVVRERTAAEAMTAVEFTPPAPLTHYAASLDVSGIDVAAYQTIRTFLRRSPALAPEVRVRLARDLTDRVRPRVQPAPPIGTPDEAFLLAVAAAVQARRRSVFPTEPPTQAPTGHTPQPPPVPPSTGSPPAGPAQDPTPSAERADGPTPPPSGEGFSPPA